ncbi:MAG: hypothetical protein HC836_49890 [Richelia sp. RM2_1_2]|nr:hypothetical protein [Richelia sp. RM1_1_1]NJO65904.1 hypothetical protein [Richelia sp. RM2_1_2]
MKLTPKEFCAKYLPESWCERDLQLYIQKVIRQKWGMGIWQPPDEVVVATPNSRRRIDLATPLTVYECKCWLTYDNIYHAIAQTEIYTRYGGKILGIIKKQRIVIGVAPIDFKEYESARKLAKDFSNLKGIKVIFINECPEWYLQHSEHSANKYLLYIIYFLCLFIASFITVVLIFS